MTKSGELPFCAAALEHIDVLYGFAMTLTRDRTEAEDLVQETYLKAVRAQEQLLPNSNLKAWLFVIMRNTWLNQIRHDTSGPRFLKLDDELAANQLSDQLADDPHVVYLRKLDSAEIRQAIERLPVQYREIIVLRDLEGFSYQEIAAILACPAGTVMSRLGRARAKLRSLLGNLRTARAAGAS